jgi:hypothetical protein
MLTYTEKVKIVNSVFNFEPVELKSGVVISSMEQAGKVVKNNFSKESGKKYEFETKDEFIKAIKKYQKSLESIQPKQEVKTLLTDNDRFNIMKSILPKGTVKSIVNEYLDVFKTNLFSDAEKFRAFVDKKLKEADMINDSKAEREKAKKQMRKERLDKEEILRDYPLPKKELYLSYDNIFEIVMEKYFTEFEDATAWIVENLTIKGLGDLVNVGYRYTFRDEKDFREYLKDMEKGVVENKHLIIQAEIEAEQVANAKVFEMRPEARTNIIEAYDAYLKVEEVFDESLGTVIRNRVANTTWKFLVTKKFIRGKEVIRPRVGGKLVRMLLEDMELNSVVKHFQTKNDKKTKIGSASYFDVAAIKMYYDLALTEYRSNVSPKQRLAITAIVDSFVGDNVPKLMWHYLATNQSVDCFISDRYDEDEDSLELLRRHITTQYDTPLRAAAGQPKAKKAKK